MARRRHRVSIKSARKIAIEERARELHRTYQTDNWRWESNEISTVSYIRAGYETPAARCGKVLVAAHAGREIALRLTFVDALPYPDARPRIIQIRRHLTLKTARYGDNAPNRLGPLFNRAAVRLRPRVEFAEALDLVSGVFELLRMTCAVDMGLDRGERTKLFNTTFAELAGDRLLAHATHLYAVGGEMDVNRNIPQVEIPPEDRARYAASMRPLEPFNVSFKK